MRGNYNLIEPTAWAVAYKRQLADIDYAKEIFQQIFPLIEAADKNQKEYFEKAKDTRNAAQLEARYRLIDRVLQELKPKQIFELASGLAPRGLAMTSHEPALVYIELDLPNVIAEKKRIANNLTASLSKPNNLFFYSGDALDQNSMIKAVKGFPEKNITIVNEGLLRYLDFNQKKIVAENILFLLKEWGGIWVTADITLKKLIISSSKGLEYQRIRKLSGIDINQNSFQSIDQAEEFFNDLGFVVERRSFLEVKDQLISPDKIGMSEDEVYRTIKDGVVFIMRPA